jgi:hypothetical protein
MYTATLQRRHRYTDRDASDVVVVYIDALYVVVVSYQFNHLCFIMEPTFTSSASSSSVTLELQAQIDAAIAALPTAHRRVPTKGEIVESKETALLRLQDWAFTYGFALAIESSTADRVRF